MAQKKYDLLALGEALLRLSAPENERIMRSTSFEKRVGGAELNVVAAVSMMGLQTGMISKVPDNALTTFVENSMRELGVQTEYIVYDQEKDARLGTYYYEKGAHPRKPAIVYDRMYTSMYKLQITDFPKEIYEATRYFHTTGITLALGGKVRETAIEMIKKFKEHGAMISFDVNFRGNLWTGAEAKECIEQILPYVDVFFCSEDTARLTFLKEGNVKEIMRSFTEEYPISIVAATQRIVHSPKVHSFGSLIYNAKTGIYYEEKPYEKIDVVDRIGSGDAYIAGVLYGLLNEKEDCQKAMEYGNAASALKNTISGDLLATNLRELNKIIEDHKNTGRQAEMER